jgi:hypothetical protein
MAALTKKGSFSYLQDNINVIRLDANTTIRIERVDINVARIYFVDNSQVQQPIPDHITVVTQAGGLVPPFLNNFLITWVDSYSLRAHGQVFLNLSNQKQQSISAPANAESGIL